MANLLPNGRKVTPNLRLVFVVQDENRSSSMTRQSAEAAALSSTGTIIWDEAPMTPKMMLGTVSILLREIRQDDAIFGGKTMLLGGNFRQLLPVVERGFQGEIADACLKRSPFWQNSQTLRLSGIMRFVGDDAELREWHLKIGDGRPRSVIDSPKDMYVANNLADADFGEAFSLDTTRIWHETSRCGTLSMKKLCDND